MKKWIGLSLAVALIAISSPANADGFRRLTRLVAEEEVPQVAPAPSEEAPEPQAVVPDVVDESYGKYSSGYGYPFVDGCCSTPSNGCNGIWNGYVSGRRCGHSWLHRGGCGLKGGGCSTCGPTCYYPKVSYAGCDPCGTCCGGCSLRRGPDFCSWLRCRPRSCFVGKGCTDGCGYGCGYGYGGYGFGGYGYGYSSGCDTCGGGAVIKNGDAIQGDVVEPAPEQQPQQLEAPAPPDSSARSRQFPRRLPMTNTSLGF
jgi:hypothetical protein